ncbi:MAG: protein-L-isoaspartate(D-aspartate) O-methyltransferase [Proteobacteria bacterium]|nr:protein-L-isoaspartate(D-aspartate) O-methyltransferase [Pseudomonadota bacterium]
MNPECKDFSKFRAAMVELQLKRRGVKSAVVLAAMGKVRREAFVPRAFRDVAYDDRPLDIGLGQTISQPLVVAMMAEALEVKDGDKILEVGTGSGYAAAVLGEIGGEVFSIERHRALAEKARAALKAEGCDNVHVVVGDGSLGLAAEAPFDAILVTAGGPNVPESLKQQLKIGGRLVIPVGGTRSFQDLLKITRNSETEFTEENLGGVRFVPLVGEEGWKDDSGNF